jgi:hypothetical protein
MSPLGHLAQAECAPMKSVSFLLAALAPLSLQAQAPTECAATIAQLRALASDPAFPLRWQETTMNDGKPLIVSITERDGALVLEFVKTGEGLWAVSTSVVCKAGADLEARFTSEQVRLGPAANWVLRGALGSGGAFKLTRLSPNLLRIATTGWSGTFAPLEK